MSAANPTLEVAGSTVPWIVVAVEVNERVHAPWRARVRCRVSHEGAPDDERALVSMICEKATLTLPVDVGDQARVLVGIVDSVERTFEEWTFELAPRGLPVLESRDYRVSLEQDAVAIAKELFERAGYTVRLHLAGKPPKRAQRVQSFERALDYASRLLAHDGVLWCFDPKDAEVVCFIDDATGFFAHPGAFEVGELKALQTLALGVEVVFDVRLRRRVRTSKVTVRDWSFENTNLDLTASKSIVGGPPLERYEYRLGYQDKAIGESLALARLQAHRRDHCVLSGATLCPTVGAGQVLTLDATEAAIKGNWIVTRVNYVWSVDDTDGRMRATFDAVPESDGHRPAAPSARRMPGMQTMTVTGASGEEIHPDQHGRIKAKHRWDRVRLADDKSSSWLRVMQPAMPGAMLIPRVGWEIAAAFWGDSTDEPFIIGRLDNGKARPPSALPGHAVVSSFGSATTPGGGSGNVISFNDTAGNEGMHFNASSAYSERTANDKVASVSAACATTVGGNRTVTIGDGHVVAVGAAQAVTVSGSRSETVTSNINVHAGSEVVLVGGARIFTIKGDQQVTCNVLGRIVGAARVLTCIESFSLKVVGAIGVAVGASMDQTSGAAHDITVAGYCKEVVAGVKSINAARDYNLHVRASASESYATRAITGTEILEAATGAFTITSKGAASLKGANVTFKAASFTIKADGLTIDISPGSVKVTGKHNSNQSGVGPEGAKYGT